MNKNYYLKIVFIIMCWPLCSLSAHLDGLNVSFLGEVSPPDIALGAMTSKDLDQSLAETMALFQVSEKLPYYFYISYGQVVDYYEHIKVELKIEGAVASYLERGYKPLIISLYEQGGGEEGLLIFDSDETVNDQENSSIFAIFSAANFSINEYTDGENRAIFVLTFYKDSH